MAHQHSVYDTDLHFKIDPVTREIKKTAVKAVIIQGDHNSERFTFEIPRYVEEHDMTLCTDIKIHYLNVSADKSQQSADIYPVTDMTISPESDDVVIFSWLLSRNAAAYVGTLNFAISFECNVDGVNEYTWKTGINSNVLVSDSIYNNDIIVEEYSDLLEAWKAEIDKNFSALDDRYVRHINSTGDAVYAYSNNKDMPIPYSFYPDENTIARRTNTGTLRVAEPTDDADATTMRYVAENFVPRCTRSSGQYLYRYRNGEDGFVEYSGQATENSVAQRTTGGRLRVGEPTEDNNATTKLYVDNLVNQCVPRSKATSGNYLYRRLEGNEGVIIYTQSANANTIAYRGDGGRVKVGTPTEGEDATTKKYVDEAIANASGGSSVGVIDLNALFEGSDFTLTVDDLDNASALAEKLNQTFAGYDSTDFHFHDAEMPILKGKATLISDSDPYTVQREYKCVGRELVFYGEDGTNGGEFICDFQFDNKILRLYQPCIAHEDYYFCNDAAVWRVLE